MVQTAQKEQSEHLQRPDILQRVRRKAGLPLAKGWLAVFYCKFCHVSISEKDLWNGIYKELYQRLEEHKNLKKLMLKNSGKSNLETKKVALSREMEQQIQRLRTEKDQIFQPVKKDTDSLQAVMNTVGEVGDVMHLSQNVVGTFIDRIEVFNDERVKIRFTFEDTLKSYETG